MVEHDGDFDALAETTVFLTYFKEMPNRKRTRKLHDDQAHGQQSHPQSPRRMTAAWDDDFLASLVKA